MSEKFVAILMGSDSDYGTIEPAVEILKSFDIKFEVKVTSAHRTPMETMNYVKKAEERGCAVFICAAGLAAHLAGAVAANTTCPVIGVPINCGPLNGIDALLSTVQMPGGIPVATMAIGKAGAKNAAYFAVQILAVSDPELMNKFRMDRIRNADAVNRKNEALQSRIHGEKVFD
jgi:5-(carboxyamino)imidazole ribonucleotide mutase